jgi:SAM-dependent methyltransferase
MEETKKELKLDLGCGKRPEGHLTRQAGFIGVDIAAIEGVDVVHDLTKFPYPFKDNSVEEIFCSHFIEHITGDDQMKFFNELYRIMKPGAKALMIAPYYNSARCWQDPTHKTAISEARFMYYNKEWRTINNLDHYPITCDFDFTYGYDLAPEWKLKSQEAQVFAIKHYTNVVNDIHVTLIKRG